MSGPDRTTVEFLGPEKWGQLKSAIRQGCDRIGETLSLQYHEDGDEFIVERIQDGWAMKRLRLEYDALVPCIRWSCADPQEHSGVIELRLMEGGLHFMVSRRIMVLTEVAGWLASCVTGKR